MPNFRLWHVFYVVALIAVSFAFSLGLLVLAAIWFWICRSSSGHPTLNGRVRQLVSLSIFTGVLCCCLAVVANPWRIDFPPYRTQCKNNMRQLMLAMQNFDSAHQQLPNASELNSDGKPMHSWRVRILPFIDEQALHDQYDFQQPWDSLTNRKLINQMPDVFRCPGDEQTPDGQTRYKLVVGPGTLHDGGETHFFRIEDGSSNTIALIEDVNNPVQWTRPADATVDEAIASIQFLRNKNAHLSYETKFSYAYSAANFVRYDGSVSHAGFTGDEKQLQTLFGIDDGYPDTDLLERTRSISVLKPTPWIALSIFLVLMSLPFGWVFRGKDTAQYHPEPPPPTIE